MASIQDSNNLEDEKRDLMSHFPPEIAADIASRLAIKSLIRFRLVCKPWKSLSRHPLFLGSCHSRALSRDPCLILHTVTRLGTELYLAEFPGSSTDDDHHDDKETLMVNYKKLHQNPLSTANMAFFSVVGSCNGLLCLLINNSSSGTDIDTDHHDELWLHNPFTRNYKQLPKLSTKLVHQYMFGFGFHSSTVKDQFKIIKICYPRSNSSSLFHFTSNNNNDDEVLIRSEVLVLTIGSKTWRNIGEVPDHYKLLVKKPGVSINGRIHWVCEWSYKVNDRKIVSFDLSDELFKEIPKPKFHHRWYNCQLHHLQGCLATAVFLPANNGSCIFDIWIMEKYGIPESWIKKFTIRDYLTQIMGADYRLSMQLRKEFCTGSLVKVLCLLKNGEILLEFRGETLVSYNPESGMCENLRLQGMPNLFETIVHVGSLNWID